MNYQQRKWRDAIRNEYLTETGATTFDPDGFLEWLSGKPDHEAYPLFFGDVALQARDHRIGQVEKFTEGLRLTAAS